MGIIIHIIHIFYIFYGGLYLLKYTELLNSYIQLASKVLWMKLTCHKNVLRCILHALYCNCGRSVLLLLFIM